MYGSIALLVVIAEFAAQAGENIGDAGLMMRPLVDAGIFQVEHHSGRARVQHLHAEFAIIGGPRHLVALVLAPVGQRDPPAIAHRVGREVMRGLFAFERSLQHFDPLLRKLLLPRSEPPVQREKKIHKAGGQIARGIEPARRGADGVNQSVRLRCGNCGWRHDR